MKKERKFDIACPLRRGQKTRWMQIGAGYEGENGIQCVLDALPLPELTDAGRSLRFSFWLFPVTEEWQPRLPIGEGGSKGKEKKK